MTEFPVVMITGASGGIGSAVVRQMSARGYNVALLGTKESTLKRVANDLDLADDKSLILPGDLADLAYAESAVDRTLSRFGRIDVLINNAAWRELATMREITVESWERTLRVCLTAPAFLARWCAADMQKRGKGVVVNVTSLMSQQAAGFSPAYVACKGALESLTYELAALYGPHGLRVVSIAPGAIDTQMSADISDNAPDADKAIRKFSESMIPLGRWGTSEEVAKAIAWIASDDAAYITATSLVVDGGWLHHHLPTRLAAQLKPDQF